VKSRQEILDEIAHLKRDKAPQWERAVKKLIRELENMEDPYWECEDHGTEERGRHSRPAKWRSAASYDRMDDNSEPDLWSNPATW
jgi:hypothetical protein